MASVSDIGLAALKSREGVRLVAYRDSVGVPTIGWGHTLGVKMGQSITREQAGAFLRADIGTHAAPILAAVMMPLADREADALVSIAFNIGERASPRDRERVAGPIRTRGREPDLVDAGC